MSEPAIRVENLGKKYRLRHQQEGLRYKTLREALTRAPQRWLARRSGAGSLPSASEDFWALRDVSFEIPQGQAVGIVGRNGAGKSTLLKLLSRITQPTTGRIDIEGRIASLLEVGTGFHPELTGRENIYLNGAILGMTRAEIKSRFDEIVAFSEVEKFLDTPVKHFSSGMYMRLAFAVAAHLEPEILIVDEVLAVGDMEFQKKCLGKMEDVSKGGRTVLFVSHNMDAILRLCSRAIHLSKGGVVEVGTAQSVVAQYLASHKAQPAKVVFPANPADQMSRRNLVLLSAEWPDSPAFPPWTIPFGEEISFFITFECHQPVHAAELGLALYAPTGTEIASTSSVATLPDIRLAPGIHGFQVTYRSFKLVPNHYNFSLGLKSNFGMEDYLSKSFSLDVIQSAQSSATKADTFLGYVVPEVHYVLV
ncbi:MAG: polysaccharide ABC transporter ATP-binding protein [Chthoniobacter sp.]|uniref:ABC transporter ATP-binding protein n=1 Tax=Chthoniobacter sp. TaxID=2510640 RepID=UPI0032A6379E